MTTSTVHRLSRTAGFWAVAASMSVLTAFSTAPSALYGIYRRQDHLSSITVTIVYAVFAAGIVTSLLLVGHLSDWYGRRTLLMPALLTGLVAAVVLANSTSLPALFVGRVLTGLALGAATATATAYLTDLDAGPNGVPTRRAQITSTVANVGGLAVGPLAAGLLATYVPSFPRLIYVVLAVLLALALIAVWAAPEVRPLPNPRPRYRPQRLAIPGAARTQFGAALTGDFLVFTVYGVFAGLASAFLAGPLHRSSPVLAGLTVFIAFGVGALTQIITRTWPLRRLLALGIPVLLIGLAVIVTAAWLRPPSLTFFLIGAALVGVGTGSIFRSALTVVITTAPPNDRAAALALFFVVGYLGLSLPVVGAGIALQYVTFKVILLTFAVIVSTGILVASPLLIRSLTEKKAPVGAPGESTGVTGSERTNSGVSGSHQGIPQGNGRHMATIHFTEITTSTPEQFVAGLTDFGPGRAKLFANSSDDHLKVHDLGATYADVTEGNDSVWERLHYDWSDPTHIVLTTTDSNLWGGASGHTYTLHRRADGATTIDVTIVRQGKNLKGRLLGIVLGLFGKSVLGKPFHNSVKAIEARNLQTLTTNNNVKA